LYPRSWLVVAAAVGGSACAGLQREPGGAPPGETGSGASEDLHCDGLEALVSGATGATDSFELQFEDASCEGPVWRVSVEVDDDSDPADRIDVATWNLSTGAFGATTWPLESDSGWVWEGTVPVDASFPCEMSGDTVFVLVPWFGDVIGEMRVLERGPWLGYGLSSDGPEFSAFVDAPLGSVDEGRIVICEPGNGGLAQEGALFVVDTSDVETWFVEGLRTHSVGGWYAIFGVMLREQGAPVIAVGAVGD